MEAKSNRIPLKSVVFDCIVELYASGRGPTPSMIRQETGLTKPEVDNAVNALFNDDGKIDKAAHGVYIPHQCRVQDRAVSATAIPAGQIKCEIGDVVLDLTRTEARLLGCLLGGFSIGFGR